jgi:hypothetical protein
VSTRADLGDHGVRTQPVLFASCTKRGESVTNPSGGYGPSMTDQLASYSFPFLLRGVAGAIHVRYGVNDDPRRWGYESLNLDWYQEDFVRGFPVMEASVEHSAEGYGADMGWMQIVEYEVRDPGEEERVTVFDVPPQLSHTDMPYLAFGVRPTAFDAPAISSREVTWRANTFLTYTPDAVLSRVVRSVGGFTWGYDVVAGVVSVAPLAAASRDAWTALMPALEERFPNWTLLDDPWDE